MECTVFSQTTFEGKITDERGNAVFGANVYLKDTYYGSTTDTLGRYKFAATLNGESVLVVSFMGFNTIEKPVNFKTSQKLDIKLTESVNSIGAVTITAGSFDASDEKRQ